MMKEMKYAESVIRQQLPADAWDWLAEKGRLVAQEKTGSVLQETFNRIPRKTGNAPVMATHPEDHNLYIRGWTLDRLCRVWLIMQIDSTDKAAYLAKTGSLFSGASMNELVALYSALPVLAYPQDWRMRCADGIRSNIATVLEAIMYENSYPMNYLDEAAFNQMVLKAFFTDKNVDRIMGLDRRANRNLSLILFDYAHERWAAGRSVDPQLWRLTSGFIDEEHFPDIERLWNSGDPEEKKAALLVCEKSSYPAAQTLWEGGGALKKDVLDQKINWHNLHG